MSVPPAQPPELRTPATLVHIALHDLRTIAEVIDRPEFGMVEVRTSVTWPFPAGDGHRGLSMHTSHAIDYSHLTTEPAALAVVRAVLERMHAAMLENLVPVLLDQAFGMGIRNRLLAPFAREVVNRIVEHGGESFGARNTQAAIVAAPFTDADGQDPRWH